MSFAFGRDLHRMETIERYTRQPVKRERVPSQEQVEGRVADRFFEQLKERLTKGAFHSHEAQLDRLLEQGFTPTDVVSALFTALSEESGREFNEIQEDREEPGMRRQRREPKERRQPRERRPRGERDGPHDNSDMVPLFLSLGKQQGVKVGEIIGMLYNESGVPEGSIGHVRLFPRNSRIEVKSAVADRIIEAVRDSTLRGRRFILDHDRGPRGRD